MVKIDALISSGQPIPSNDHPGPVQVDQGNFGQLLRALSSGEVSGQGDTAAALPFGTKSPTAVLLPLTDPDLFGVNLTAKEVEMGRTADLTETNGEPTISLTDLIAALQSAVTQGKITGSDPAAVVLADHPAEPTPDNSPADPDKSQDILNSTLVSLIAGLNLWQTPAALPPTPTGISETPGFGAVEAMEQSASTPMPAWPIQAGQVSAEVDAAPVVGLPEAPVDLVARNDENEVAPARLSMGSEFAEMLAGETNDTAAGSQPAALPGLDESSPGRTVTPVTRSNSSVPLPVQVDSTLMLGGQPPVVNVQGTVLPVSLELPTIPALQQLVERVRVMARQGETAVRLQLHPKALGEILIQLHFKGSDVSIQMVAETAHAHSLIQEHLPQLKAAFTEQGLQINGLEVAVGSDGAAFSQDNRQPGEWSEPAPYRPISPVFEDAGASLTATPRSTLWGDLHAVDYSV